MFNYHKEGYSSHEVAQILGCNYHTILNWITQGKMKALVKKPTTPNGRRVVRITRDNLKEFLLNNKERYSQTLLDAFHVEEKSTQTNTSRKTTIVDPKTKTEVKFGEPPTGPWGELLENKQPEIKKEIKPEVKPEIKNIKVENTNIRQEHYSRSSCEILIDGRIAVGNITKQTANAIFNALCRDTNIKMTSLEIKFK